MTGSVKKSNFLSWGDQAIPNSGTIDFVYNGVNYKQTYSNFLGNLGVTGSLAQLGDPTAAPVLDVQGSINGIRNIKGGFGVTAVVSDDDSIEVSVGYSFDETGVELVDDVTASEPVFRSIVAGGGISVSGSSGIIQISASDIPASTKTVVVNQLSDFPAAVLGVITLASDTEYLIRNDISTSSRFVVGNNTVITGADEAVTNLTYTGSGIMFTATSASCTFKNIKLSCTAGTLIDFNGSGSEILQFLNCIILAGTVGTISDFLGMRFEGTQGVITTNGILFAGANGVFLVDASFVTISAGKMFDLDSATFDSVSITDGFYTLNGTSVFLDGAASSANINSGGLGSVHNCRFFGTGTALQTITYLDIRWQFFINDDIGETHSDCLMSLVGNVTATTISAVSTPALIAGAWNEEHAAQFSTTAAGRMTYNGIKPSHKPITMSFTAEPVSGSNKEISFYAVKNGVVINNSEASAVISAGSSRRVTLVWLSALDPGDYIEAYTENETDDIDILVSNAVMRIG